MNFKLGLLCLLFGCAGPSLSISSVPAASPDEIEPEGFRHAYLYGANFNGADLQGVDLYRCQLGQADLRNADLRNANLAGAYLFKTDLRGADLRGARFSPTLKGAELKQTVLVGARFDASTQLPFSAEEAMRRGMIPTAMNVEVASNF